jgi:hypothetical protein
MASLDYSVAGLRFSCRKRRRSEIHAEALTPHGDGAILREVDARRQIVVLIADVALDGAEIDEAGVFYRRVVLSVRRRDEVNMHVGGVGGLEAAEAQHLLAFRQPVDRRRALGFMGDAAERSFRDLHRHRHRRGQRGLTEVHAEARTPDRDVRPGRDYASITFADLHERICDALRGKGPGAVAQSFTGDGGVQLVLSDGRVIDSRKR